MTRKLLLTFLLFYFYCSLSAQSIMITEKNGSSVFPVVTVSGHTLIYVDKNDHWLIHRAAELLRQDLKMLTGQTATITSQLPESSDHVIIIGSLDSSDMVKKLAAENKIQTAG